MDDEMQTSETDSEAGTHQGYAPNPMAIEEVTGSSPDTPDTGAQPPASVDLFDAERHNGILDRLEHELALVDAALSHIDDDDLDAADTAIKELVRHNDDGQVALPLRSVSYTHLTLPTTPYV